MREALTYKLQAHFHTSHQPLSFQSLPQKRRLLKTAIKQSRIVWILLLTASISTVILLNISPLLDDGYVLFLPIWQVNLYLIYHVLPTANTKHLISFLKAPLRHQQRRLQILFDVFLSIRIDLVVLCLLC